GMRNSVGTKAKAGGPAASEEGQFADQDRNHQNLRRVQVLVKAVVFNSDQCRIPRAPCFAPNRAEQRIQG
ncbi:MAG: hypothetical protein R3B07_27865, partial [Polyangiaceae bacterium]